MWTRAASFFIIYLHRQLIRLFLRLIIKRQRKQRNRLVLSWSTTKTEVIMNMIFCCLLIIQLIIAALLRGVLYHRVL